VSEPMPLRVPVQLAYHVPDAAAAAAEFARLHGWGPFFLMEHIPLADCVYRGAAAHFDHTSAYGQAGEVMVEFIQSHGETPNVLNEAFASGATGLHHVAMFETDLGVALSAWEQRGFAVAMRATTTTGVEFAMVDTRTLLGHYLELYPPVRGLQKFYAHVKRAAIDWDGSDPVRRL
jgi:Glyoxalase/Bleomycin resistance protein/Dioxygenase superfamily